MPRCFFLLPILCLALATAHPVIADACRDEVVALYDAGGPMDDFARRPYHTAIIHVAEDGTAIDRNIGQVIDGTRYTLFSEVRNMGVLFVGTDVWYSMMGPDGPWGNHQVVPEVRFDDLKRQQAEKAQSASETECLGVVERDGKTYLSYRWRVHTETLEEYGGGVNGAVHQAWIDPATNELMVRMDSEVVTPWQKEPDGSTVLTTFAYDDSITITAPE